MNPLAGACHLCSITPEIHAVGLCLAHLPLGGSTPSLQLPLTGQPCNQPSLESCMRSPGCGRHLHNPRLHCYPHNDYRERLIGCAIADGCQEWLQEVAAKLEPVPRKKRDRTALGLGLYALSSCFLATMLMFAKKLGTALCISLPCQHLVPCRQLPMNRTCYQNCTSECSASYIFVDSYTLITLWPVPKTPVPAKDEKRVWGKSCGYDILLAIALQASGAFLPSRCSWRGVAFLSSLLS